MKRWDVKRNIPDITNCLSIYLCHLPLMQAEVIDQYKCPAYAMDIGCAGKFCAGFACVLLPADNSIYRYGNDFTIFILKTEA